VRFRRTIRLAARGRRDMQRFGQRGGRCPLGARTVAVGPAGRLRCDARITRAAACPGACRRQGVRQAWDSPQGTVPRPGSLPPFAALNALRTSRRPRRSAASGGLPLALLRFSPRHKSPPPGTAHRAGALVVFDDACHGSAGKAVVGCAPAATLRGAEERRARGRARAARASTSDSRRLFERSERSERSEFRRGPRDRAPQGSRPAGPTAVHERRRIPGRGFASSISANTRAAAPTRQQ